MNDPTPPIVTRTLAALNNEVRRKMLYHIRETANCTTYMITQGFVMSRVNAVWHLKKLQEANLLTTEHPRLINQRGHRQIMYVYHLTPYAIGWLRFLEAIHDGEANPLD